jgi:tetratricopeptide (TPR) repeat protein
MLAARLALRSCTPELETVESVPPPPRELFHASKPIQIRVIAHEEAQAPGATEDARWLEFELRHLLSRAKMRVAPVGATPIAGIHTLQVDLGAQEQATLSLVSPDEAIERSASVLLEGHHRLGILSAIAARLPAFLDAGHASHDWVALIGTHDEDAFDMYQSAALALLGAEGHGFTRPPRTRTRTVEQLEALTRAQPRFARAWAALAVGYLSLGGEDAHSLTQLAQSTAQQALLLDDELAHAHAAMGLVHLRRGEWMAAREKFDRALALDINSVPALEGLACLLADTGHYAAARPLVDRALALQQGNIGAQECLEYANLPTRAASQKDAQADPHDDSGDGDHPAPSGADAASPISAPAAQVRALTAILNADLPAARRLLQGSLDAREFDDWATPVLRAAATRRDIPDALQAVTRAANEGRIDADTEILCGTALRQSDFVFNRLSRLQRQREHMPLRILWMPDTGFLRQHPRFEQVLGAAGLAAFWQEHGAPDICAREPSLFACRLRTVATPRTRR